MTKEVKTIHSSEPVARALSLMVENFIGSIVIVENDGKPVGIITERDILRLVSRSDSIQMPAGDEMSTPLFTVRGSDQLMIALSLMRDKKVRRLPVLREEYLVGIITERDIAEWIVDHPNIIPNILVETYPSFRRTIVSELLSSNEPVTRPGNPFD